MTLTCLQQQSRSDMESEIEARISIVGVDITNVKSQIQAATETANRLHNIALNREGDITKALYKSLKELQIDIYAYQGGAFVGNQAMKLITGKGPIVITSAFESGSETQKKFQWYFEQVGKIYKIISKADFLEESEIDHLDQYCKEFRQGFVTKFPDQHLTVKMHMLEHLPEFARRHRTLGLLSEQGLESLHQVVNRLYRIFLCIRNKQRKQALLHRSLHISSAAALLTASKRSDRLKRIHKSKS